MVTIKVTQLHHQIRKDGTCPILIRVTENRKVKYLKTGFAVKPTQFREGTDSWVYKHNDSTLINLALEKKRSQLFEDAIMSDLGGEKMGLHKKSRSFFQTVMDRLNEHEGRAQVGSHAKLSSVFKNVKAIWGRDYALHEISKDMVDKYITARMKGGTSITTLKKDIAVMSGVLIWAEHTGKNYFHLAQSQIKAVEPNKEKLTAKEIEAFEKTKLTGLAEIARDMFLFSFYTHGMRFQNVAMFEEKSIKNGKIIYRMNKGKKIREIEVHPKLAAIIKKYKGKSLYLFPVLKATPKDGWEIKHLVGNANALINLNLKRAAVICGIDKSVNFHQSRHTFAYLSLRRGVSRSILKDALGHSDFSVTERYLKSLGDDEINEAVKGLYD